MTTTIKAKVQGRTYTACFYDTSFSQLKELNANEAIDVEEFGDSMWWAVHFVSKVDSPDYTIVVKFKIDEDGERTVEPICAEVLNEGGIIIEEYEIESVTVNK